MLPNTLMGGVLAGILFLIGTVLMAINLLRTFAGVRTVEVTSPILASAHRDATLGAA